MEKRNPKTRRKFWIICLKAIRETNKKVEKNIQIQSCASFAEGKNKLFSNELLASISKKHNKTMAQVVLRWLIQRGVAVIPKSVNKDRMIENIDVFDFTLSTEDMHAIQTLDVKESLFFSLRDPEIVKWLTSRRLSE